MNTSLQSRRGWVMGAVAAIALLSAPLAMADPLGFSLGLFAPGFGVSYSGCSGHWCGGRGFVSAYVNSGWGWGDDDEGGRVYYAPSYYEEPAPVYYSRVVYREPVERVYYREDGRGDYWRGRDGGWRGNEGWRGREGWTRDREGGWRREGDRGYRHDGPRGDQRHGGGDGGHGYWGHDGGRGR